MYRKLMLVLMGLAALALAVGLVGCPQAPEQAGPRGIPPGMPIDTPTPPEPVEEEIEEPEEEPTEVEAPSPTGPGTRP